MTTVSTACIARVLPGGGEGADASTPADAGISTDAGLPKDAGNAVPDAGAADAGNPNCVGLTPRVYDATTDRQVRMPPVPPTLGDAGSVYLDPDYGTRVLRVTDSTSPFPNDSYLVTNGFSGVDWSLDSRFFYLQDDHGGGVVIYQFDPASLSASPVMDTVNPGQPLSMPVWGGGFSRSQANILYGFKGLTLAQYDLATRTTSNLVDLTTLAPCATSPCYVLGVQHGANGLLVSSFGGNEQDRMPYILTWDTASGTAHVVDVVQSTLDGQALAAADGGTLITGGLGVHLYLLDASGRYLVFFVANATSTTTWLWDTTTQTVSPFGSYGVLGWGTSIQVTSYTESYDWVEQSFATGSASSLISPLPSPASSHVSSSLTWANAIAGASLPVIAETMRQPGDSDPWRAWDNELIAIRTDVAADGGAPSSEVWRFAHNFNDYDGGMYSDAFYYLYIPRVSQDGRFVLFDSNWNKGLGIDGQGNQRTDMFIAALPNPCGP